MTDKNALLAAELRSLANNCRDGGFDTGTEGPTTTVMHIGFIAARHQLLRSAEALAQQPAPSAPEAQGGREVVAEVCEDQSGSKYMCWNPGLTPLPPAGTKLYTAPPSATVEEISDADIKWDMRHIESHLKDVEVAVPVLLQGVRKAIRRALAQQAAHD